ncbi:MAG: CDC48 family AAA ATPase [Myxococcota bacterium]
MAEREREAIRLQVAGAKTEDAGTGTARVPMEVMSRLGLPEGGLVEIEGKRVTAAIALPPYPEDSGLNIIRLDGLQRGNVGAGFGDSVMVSAAEARPAKKVTLAPGHKNLRLSGPGEALRKTLLRRPLVSGDTISTSVYRRVPGMDGATKPQDIMSMFRAQRAYGLQEIRLVVASTKPRGVVYVDEDTQMELHPEFVEPEEPRSTEVTYDDVGGLHQTIDQIREMVELPLKHPELFQRLGIDPPKGVLLHGPPGTGKTLLARAVAHEADAAFFSINGPEIIGKHYGESEQRLRDIFSEAQRESPAVIFIDEIDSIAPKRGEVSGEAERRLVAQLLTLMDGLEPRQNVIVIAATNRVEALDEALRRPGRFDREIIIGVPDQKGRKDVLFIHTRGMPMADDVDLDQLSRITFGFVGADLAALCREAALDALRRKLPEIEFGKEIPAEVLDELIVTHDDFMDALRRIQPSALREIMIQAPNVRWDDIGGLEDTKRSLREGVEMPLKQPEAFRRMGIRPARGFLLFGPPGTGKTLLGKAVATEAEANFIFARSSDLLSKWYGESEQQVAKLFQRARQVAPTVIFLDELDSLAPRRGQSLGEPAVTERVVNTILAEMDGLEDLQGVVVMAATNQPMHLDPALLRPGRFDELIYVPVPGYDGRLRILQIHTSDMPVASDVDLASIAERTEGYSGADLEDLTRRAGLLAIRADAEAQEVPMACFEQALEETRASVTREMDESYRRMATSLKQEAPTDSRRIGFLDRNSD